MTTLNNALASRGKSIKDNLAASVDPTAANDVSQGYQVGSIWMNASKGRVFIARSVAAAAAVWVTISPGNHPGYVNDRWYNAIEGFNAQMTLAAVALNGKITFYPAYIRERITVSALGVRIGTTATGNVQAAVYRNNPVTMRPTGTPVASTTSMSTASAVNVNAAVNVVLEPGLYWFGTNIDNATGRLIGYNSASQALGNLIGGAAQSDVLAGQVGLSCLQVTQTFGTWPDATAATFTPVTGTAVPVVQYKVGGASVAAALFTATPALDANDTGNYGFSFRILIPLTGTVGTQIRATIRPGTDPGTGLTVTHASFGKWAGSIYSSVTDTPIELKFGGASGFVNATTPQTSDWADLGALSFGPSDKMVVIYDVIGGGGPTVAAQRYNNANTGVTTYFKDIISWNVANVESPNLGFNDIPNMNYCIDSVETR